MTEGGDDSVFVTVGVAAKHLGVADRTAQRYAAKLSDSDRQVSDNGGPQKVRLSAMAARAKEAAARAPAPSVRQADGQVSDSDVPRDGQVSDTEKSKAGDAQAAFVAQLQGEVQYLRDALKAEQENTRAALAELHDARREGQMIMGAVAAGRIQLPSGPQETMQADTEGELQKASSDESRAAATEAGQERETTTAPWWAFWKAKSQ